MNLWHCVCTEILFICFPPVFDYGIHILGANFTLWLQKSCPGSVNLATKLLVKFSGRFTFETLSLLLVSLGHSPGFICSQDVLGRTIHHTQGWWPLTEMKFDRLEHEPKKIWFVQLRQINTKAEGGSVWKCFIWNKPVIHASLQQSGISCISIKIHK